MADLGFSASWPPHLTSYVATWLSKVESKDTSSSGGCRAEVLTPVVVWWWKLTGGRRWLWDFLGIKGLFYSNTYVHRSQKWPLQYQSLPTWSRFSAQNSVFAFHSISIAHAKGQGADSTAFLQELDGTSWLSRKMSFSLKGNTKRSSKSGEK